MRDLLGTGDPLNEQRVQMSLAEPLSGNEAMLIDASGGTILLRQLEVAAIPPATSIPSTSETSMTML